MSAVASANAGKGGTSENDAVAIRARHLAIWIILFLLLHTFAPLAGALPAPLAHPTLLLCFMFFSLLGPRLLAPLILPVLYQVLFLLGAGALSLLTASAQFLVAARYHAILPAAFLAGLSDLLLIVTAALCGQLLSRLFREPNILVPAAIVAGLIDYWGVYFGTTRAVLEHHASVVSKLSVQVPLPNVDMQIGIGFGDFVFMTLFLACARRFSLREGLTFWLSFLFLLTAMTFVVFTGMNVPALVPMSAAFLIANIGRFRFQRSEVLALIYAALIVATLIGVFIFLGHHR